MKILEATFGLSSGGAERFCVDLSNELSSRGNDVTLLTLKDDRIDTEHRCFYRFDLRKEVEYKNAHIPDGFQIKSLWQVYKAIQKEKADIVHFHLGAQFYWLAILLLHRKALFFMTIHNDMSCFNNAFHKLFFRTMGRMHWVRFIAISDVIYEDLIRMYPGVSVCKIKNGRSPILPTKAYSEVELEINALKKDAKTKVVIHIARCAEQKNQLLLIRAFNELVTSGEDVILLILGNGYDSELGLQLKAEASDENIFFLGSHKNISDYLLHADVFCLSSHFEGLPITLLEASLAGIPAVCTKVSGATDMITDGVTGKLSTDFSVEEYTEALRFVLTHNDELKCNAIKLKESSTFTIKHCTDLYSRFFENKAL
jgi:glycosyltransferase involved in cell wall biosynthesis